MSSTPTTLEELSDDLLAEILRRLPFYVLLRCKSVNECFLRLISDPSFFRLCLTHRQLPRPAFETHTRFLLFHFILGSNYDNKMLFSVDSNNKTHVLKGSNFLPDSWPQDRDQARVRATHYDRVLCSTQNKCFTSYFVCNPFTKQYVALPPIRRSYALEITRASFICDQSCSKFWVVHIPIVCFQYVSSFQVHMFSSDTGEWSASNVNLPRRRGNDQILMSNSCLSNIFICNKKFVWWIKNHGFLVCDPFSSSDSKCRIISMDTPCAELNDSREYDIHSGVCNGRVKMCVFSKKKLASAVYELVNFEEGKWSHSACFDTVSMNNMKLLAFHPHCEHMMYFYAKEGIFLCDYKNHKLEFVYSNAVDADIRAWGNVMSLDLPEWPTPVPTLNAAKLG